jgi:hypothetical protein
MLVIKHLQLIRLQQVQQLVLQLEQVQVAEFEQLVLPQQVLVLVQVEEFAQLAQLLEQEHLVLLILLHQ